MDLVGILTTIIGFVIQIFDLFIQLIISILSFFLVLARLALTALHLL